jgi:hypothetical protein
MANEAPGGVPHLRRSGSSECVHCGHIMHAAAQEAVAANLQQGREADGQGAKDASEP